MVVAAQPTLDHMVIMPDVSVGKAYRVNQAILLPSGKALNVARSLNLLGAQVRVAALFAGHNGRWMADIIKGLGISVQSAWMGGENRIAYSVYDPVKNNITEFIEDTDGPVKAEEWAKLYELVQEMLPGSCALILAGRAPKGVPVDGYKTLVELAHNTGVPVFMDCYGPLLECAIPSHPTLVKINHQEAANILGEFPQTPQDCAIAGRQLRNLGISLVILTLGQIGAVAIGPDESWWAVPPKLVGATIGSGDAMLAGVAFALAHGMPFVEALRMGVAVGAANVLIPGAGVFQVDDVMSITQQIELTQIP